MILLKHLSQKNFSIEIPVLLFAAFVCWLIWVTPHGLYLITEDADSKSLQIIWVVIPFILLGWIIWSSGRFVFVKHLIGYPIWIAVFILYMMAYNVAMEFSFFENNIRVKMVNEYSLWTNILEAASFPFIVTLLNLIIAWMERKRVKWKAVSVLLVSSLTILILSWILTLFINEIGHLIFNTPLNPFEDSFHPAFWLANGSFILITIFYEGVFFLWVKSKLSLELEP